MDKESKKSKSFEEKAGLALAMGLYLIPWGILTSLLLDKKLNKQKHTNGR